MTIEWRGVEGYQPSWAKCWLLVGGEVKAMVYYKPDKTGRWLLVDNLSRDHIATFPTLEAAKAAAEILFS